MPGKRRDAIRRTIGDKLRALIAGGVEPHAQVLRQQLLELRQDVDLTDRRLRALLETEVEAVLRTLTWVERIAILAADQRDAIPELRRSLAVLRQGSEYAKLWRDREPLISIRIATANAGDQLVERPIASILRQTYQRFEVVVVGDRCTDNTERNLKRLNDPRIRFVNLETRLPYPDDPQMRWMVGGTPSLNLAEQLATGSWVAPLDSDDEFTDDHIETLLTAALKHRYEFVYGVCERAWIDTGVRDLVGAYPPSIGNITLQAAMYPRSLSRIFRHDTKSWLMNEPHDWNLVRRMIEADVRIGFVDKVVARLWTTRKRWRPSN